MEIKKLNPCFSCDGKCCKGLAVILTIPEALELIRSTKLPPQEVIEFTNRLDPDKVPHYPLLVMQKNRIEQYFIIIKREKKCIFLDENNRCKIYKNRPYVCRIYPFELDGIKLKEKHLCPVKFERTKEIELAAKILKDLLKLHGIVAREWNKQHTNFSELDVKKFLEYFEKPTKLAAKKYKICLPNKIK